MSSSEKLYYSTDLKAHELAKEYTSKSFDYNIGSVEQFVNAYLENFKIIKKAIKEDRSKKTF